MSVKAAAERTHQDLKKALAIGKFPANVADTAVKLLERLKEPVRLSIMGLPGSGKTTVANLLLNKLVIPEGRPARSAPRADVGRETHGYGALVYADVFFD